MKHVWKIAEKYMKHICKIKNQEHYQSAAYCAFYLVLEGFFLCRRGLSDNAVNYSPLYTHIHKRLLSLRISTNRFWKLNLLQMKCHSWQYWVHHAERRDRDTLRSKFMRFNLLSFYWEGVWYFSHPATVLIPFKNTDSSGPMAWHNVAPHSRFTIGCPHEYTLVFQIRFNDTEIQIKAFHDRWFIISWVHQPTYKCIVLWGRSETFDR